MELIKLCTTSKITPAIYERGNCTTHTTTCPLGAVSYKNLQNVSMQYTNLHIRCKVIQKRYKADTWRCHAGRRHGPALYILQKTPCVSLKHVKAPLREYKRKSQILSSGHHAPPCGRAGTRGRDAPGQFLACQPFASMTSACCPTEQHCLTRCHRLKLHRLRTRRRNLAAASMTPWSAMVPSGACNAA
jgi:hypothetical protein